MPVHKDTANPHLRGTLSAHTSVTFLVKTPNMKQLERERVDFGSQFESPVYHVRGDRMVGAVLAMVAGIDSRLPTSRLRIGSGERGTV